MPKKKNTLFIVAICLVIAALGAVVEALFCLHFEDEQEHKPIPLAFTINAAGYNIETASGIPVSIEGTDLDGNKVSQLVLLDQSVTSVGVLRGNYVIRVEGNPVNAQGTVYNIPAEPISLDFSDGKVLVNGAESAFDPEGVRTIELPAIELTPINPESVTNEQVEEIRSWMDQYNVASDRIDQYIKMIDANKQAALKMTEAQKLEAWRTKLTGDFGGPGEYAGPADARISLSVDGNKLIVKGNLHRCDSGSFSSKVSGNEWHFMLTSETTYGFVEDSRFYQTKNEFCNKFLPNKFPGVSIEVRDGYVVDICTSS